MMGNQRLNPIPRRFEKNCKLSGGNVLQNVSLPKTGLENAM